MPSDTQIANRAEKDLNTYQAKTGEARKQADNDSGTNAMAEKEFAKYGAELKDGDELSTNAGFNKRIPPSEGGETDDRGRYVACVRMHDWILMLTMYFQADARATL